MGQPSLYIKQVLTTVCSPLPVIRLLFPLPAGTSAEVSSLASHFSNPYYPCLLLMFSLELPCQKLLVLPTINPQALILSTLPFIQCRTCHLSHHRLMLPCCLSASSRIVEDLSLRSPLCVLIIPLLCCCHC